MSYKLLHVIFITFFFSFLQGMNNQQLFTFITDETEPQSIKIPLSLALQCQTIKNNINDTVLNENSSLFRIPHSDKKSTEYFISYLDKLYQQNISHLCSLMVLSCLHKTQNIPITQLPLPKSSNLDALINSLSNAELVQLSLHIDCCDVQDPYNHVHLINTLADKIGTATEKNIDDIKHFIHLNGKAIFRPVVQKLLKESKFDTKIIQTYSDKDNLQQCSSALRTEYRLTTFLKKVYNGFSWNTTRYKPYFFNPKTETIIKSKETVDPECKTINAETITIFKKNQACITINLTDIKKIEEITANKNESLFICKCIKKQDKHYSYFVIDVKNPHNNREFYTTCAFAHDDNEIYVSKQNTLHILNVTTNTLTPIELQCEKPITRIITHENGIDIALLTNETLFMGEKKNASIIFTPLPLNIPISKQSIKNICFHPTEKLAYIKTHASFYTCNYVNNEINQLVCQNLLVMADVVHHMKFISKDILCLYSNNKLTPDHFLNIKTGNIWTKDKKQNFINRLALSCDGKQSIEEIKRGPGSIHTRKISIQSTPLIDEYIIKTITQMNEGFLSLQDTFICNNPSQMITVNPDVYALLANNHNTVQHNTIITDTSYLSQTIGTLRYMYQSLKSCGSFIISCSGAIMKFLLCAAIVIMMPRDDKKSTMSKQDQEKLFENIYSGIEQLSWLIFE